MLKSIITAAAFAVLTTTSANAASATEECKTYGQSVSLLGDIRDNGIPADVVYDYLIEAGITPEIVLAMIEVVYLDGADVKPSKLGNMFVAYCLKDLL